MPRNWNGLDAQGRARLVGGPALIRICIHSCPLCTGSFSFKIMTRKKSLSLNKSIAGLLTKSNKKRQQRIYQYLLPDSSFSSVVTGDPRLLLLSKGFMQYGHSPDGRAAS